jgi:hypothetical protein
MPQSLHHTHKRSGQSPLELDPFLQKPCLYRIQVLDGTMYTVSQFEEQVGGSVALRPLGMSQKQLIAYKKGSRDNEYRPGFGRNAQKISS